MARRSNKTAHVLNLLAGHDSQNTAEESGKNEESASPAAAAPENTAAGQPDAGNGVPSDGQAAKDESGSPAANHTVNANPEPVPVSTPAPAQNISVIDTTGEDPVAELIQKELSNQFEAQLAAASPDAGAAAKTQEEPADTQGVSDAPADAGTDSGAAAQSGTTEPVPSETASNSDAASSQPDTAPNSAGPASVQPDAASVPADPAPPKQDAATAQTDSASSDTTTVQQDTAQTAAAPVLQDAASDQQTAPSDQTDSASTDIATAQQDVSSAQQGAASDQTQTESASADTATAQQDTTTKSADMPAAGSPVPESAPASEPEPEPEPEFVYLNVMEEIVKDKIIYFMRQFDVCTCERCKADTVALAMNGLLPKYIVTTPAAVDPLISYYTNKLISDVTVEATKACMVIKDNPRH